MNDRDQNVCYGTVWVGHGRKEIYSGDLGLYAALNGRILRLTLAIDPESKTLTSLYIYPNSRLDLSRDLNVCVYPDDIVRALEEPVPPR